MYDFQQLVICPKVNASGSGCIADDITATTNTHKEAVHTSHSSVLSFVMEMAEGQALPISSTSECQPHAKNTRMGTKRYWRFYLSGQPQQTFICQEWIIGADTLEARGLID